MSQLASPPSGVPDFRAVTAEALNGFVPRPKVEAALTSFLGRTRAGCVVVVGKPGSGKTSLAAALVERHGWCRHFLRLGHTEFSLWRDPYAFLTSIGFQLQAAFGEELFPDTFELDVQGQVSKVGRTGSVTGVEIARLIASPWKRHQTRVDLKASRIEGEVTAVRIGEVVEDYRSVPLGTFREMALFEPLRRLATLKPRARAVIWVDGLDEEGESGSESSPEAAATRGTRAASISRILPLGSELRALGNAVLVVSARNGAHLDRFLLDQAELIDLDDPQLKEETDHALEEIIDRELSSESTRKALGAINWPEEEVRAEVALRSEGNFLFVRQFFEALRGGLGPVLREGGVPAGLEDIYRRILSSFVQEHDQSYLTEFHPLLEVLAAAQVGLSAAQLTRFSGVDPKLVQRALRELKPLLAVEGDGADQRFALFHKSLRDSLLSERNAGALWHVDAVRAHQRIADAYFTADGTGARRIDGYGFLFGTMHLAQAGPAGRQRLFRLLHSGWRAASREACGSNRGFHADLERAADCARALPPQEAWLQTMRLGLLDVYVRDAESRVPAEALEIMVRLGQTQRALDSLPAEEGLSLAAYYTAVLRALTDGGTEELGLAARVLLEAVGRLSQKPDSLQTALARLLAVWPTGKAAALHDIFPALDAAAEAAPAEGRAEFLVERARLRAPIEPASAAGLFDGALEAVLSATPVNNELAERLIRAWAAFAPAEAGRSLTGKSLPVDHHLAAGLLSLAAAQEGMGATGSVIGCANWLLGLPRPQNSNARERALVQLEIARYGKLLRPPGVAAELIDDAKKILGAPPAGTQGAPAQSPLDANLLIRIAEIEALCRPANVQTALAEAWRVALANGGSDVEELAMLIRLQKAHDLDVLEAYASSAKGPVEERLLLALLREGVALEEPGPDKVLARMLNASEKPRATGWSFFYFGAARTCEPAKRDPAHDLLCAVSSDKDARIRWRLHMFRRLLPQDPLAARTWLRDTVRLWAQDRLNPNFADELPGAVAELPEDVAESLAELLPEVRGPQRQRLLQAALARCLYAKDPSRSEAWLAACTARGPADPAERLEEYAVLGFVAGQLRRVDPARARNVRDEAMRSLETRLPEATADPQIRYLHLCDCLRMLQAGAPEEAIPSLCALREPPDKPGRRSYTLPAPSVSPFIIANMPRSEHLLAIALARAIQRARPLVLDTLNRELPPGGFSLALALLAREDATSALPQRLAWAQQAADVATQVAPQPLQCLLRAEAAKTLAFLGARRKAREFANLISGMVLSHGHPGETVVCHAYASSLARCVQVAIALEDWTTACTWLWEGRCLGMHGYYVLLGEVLEAMPAAQPIAWDRLGEIESEAARLYPGTY